jgi:ribosome modulation factor
VTACLPPVAQVTPPMRRTAFRAGYCSGRAGHSLDANPYWPVDQRHTDWLSGHREGERASYTDQLPIVPSLDWPRRLP